ncbi:MAG: hypothetical protein WCA35_23170 [Kovacikia sp.]
MTTLRLLLIEDTPSDATLFCDQIQNSIGNDVDIEWKTHLGEAMAWLESGNEVDQIWLDPGLPDLGEKSIGKALATLKQFVEPGELRLISSNTPAIATQAQKQGVDVVAKEALISSEILQIVQTLLNKRSSGQLVSETQVKIARLEGFVESNAGRLGKIEATLERLPTLIFEIETIKKFVAEIPSLKEELKSLQGKGLLKTKQLDVMQAVIVSLLTLVGVLGAAIGPRLLEQGKPTPTSSPPGSQK